MYKSYLEELKDEFSSVESKDVFRAIEIKLAKCILILLWEIAVDDAVRWVSEMIPSCKMFKVEQAAKYLGFLLGTKTSDKLWVDQCDKMIKAACSGQVLANSFAAKAIFYNSRVLIGPYLSHCLRR